MASSQCPGNAKWERIPSFRNSKPKTKETNLTVRQRFFGSNASAVPFDMHHKMSKKIAHLTKVIYNMSLLSEDHENNIHSLKQAHEEQIQQVVTEMKSRVTHFREKADREDDLQTEVELLRKSVTEEKALKEAAEKELLLLRHRCKSSGVIQDGVGKPLLLEGTMSPILQRYSKKLKDTTESDSHALPNGDSKFGSYNSFHSKSLIPVSTSNNALTLRYIQRPFDDVHRSSSYWSSKDGGYMSCSTMRERLDTLVKQLTTSEEDCERYKKEVREFEDRLTVKDKKISMLKEQLVLEQSSVSRFSKLCQQLEANYAETKAACSQQIKEIARRLGEINMLEAIQIENESVINKLKEEKKDLLERLEEVKKVCIELENRVKSEEDKLTLYQSMLAGLHREKKLKKRNPSIESLDSLPKKEKKAMRKHLLKLQDQIKERFFNSQTNLNHEKEFSEDVGKTQSSHHVPDILENLKTSAEASQVDGSKECELLRLVQTMKAQIMELCREKDRMEQNMVNFEEEMKKSQNAVCLIREEAEKQIRNLEDYWQWKVCNELKKASVEYKKQIKTLKSNMERQETLKNDKISALQNRVQELERQLRPPSTPSQERHVIIDMEHVKENQSSALKVCPARAKTDLEPVTLPPLTSPKINSRFSKFIPFRGLLTYVRRRTLLPVISESALPPSVGVLDNASEIDEDIAETLSEIEWGPNRLQGFQGPQRVKTYHSQPDLVAKGSLHRRSSDDGSYISLRDSMVETEV